MSPVWSRSLDSDEPDLYPPDVEHITPELRQQRNRAIFGVALVTIGCGLMIERTFRTRLDYWELAVGFGLLAGWVQVRRYGAFIAGSLFTGFGFGALVTSALPLPFKSTIGMLCGAAGFLAIYVRYPHKGRWALVPAAVFSMLAVGAFGVSLIGLIPSSFLGLLLPLLLVAGGLLLLARNALPRRLVRGALAAIAVVFVASAASGVGNWDGPEFSPRHRFQVGSPSMLLGANDRTIRTISGDVTFVIGHGDSLSVSGRPGGSDDLTVTLPEGGSTDLVVQTLSGDVDGTITGSSVKVSTASGKVDLDVVGDMDIQVTTASGNVELSRAGIEDQDLQLETISGHVEVNDDKKGAGYRHETAGPSVVVKTMSGDIDLHD